MKKTIALILTLTLLMSLLAGCTGVTVVVGECTCPTDSAASGTNTPAEGALKTGLSVTTNIADSVAASDYLKAIEAKVAPLSPDKQEKIYKIICTVTEEL